MTTEKTMAEFIAENNLSMAAKFIERATSDNWDHFLWKVSLRKIGKFHDEGTITTDYRMGIAHQKWDAKATDLPPGEKPGQPVGQRCLGRSITLHAEACLKRWSRPTAPTADEVLDSLRSDAESVENCPLFEDWAGDMGYDTDSRKAERAFRACQEVRGKLMKLLGREAYDDLLANVERL